MNIRVLLTLSSGSFEDGFPATLRIREDDAVEEEKEYGGRLPPAPDIPVLFERWQEAFNAKVNPTRTSGIKNIKTSQLSCKQAATKLENRLNQWLDSNSSWQKVRDALFQNMDRNDNIRFIVRADNKILTRLPWHSWIAFFDRYQNAEVAIASSSYERVDTALSPKAKVKILGVFGEGKGLDLNADRSFLEDLRLSNAEPVFIEPNREKFARFLQQPSGWDVLFFAGHSHTENGIGTMSLTENSLEMNDLKYALQTAISKGLHLAIFNSCDGTGIADYLTQLNIPQIIIMRESVPDLVAQEFLKHFLSAYTRNKSLYSSVREAREKLQGLEEEFPCASSIPLIYQNPAVVPRTWQELGGWYSPEAENLMISQGGMDYIDLRNLLLASDWEGADRKTREIMLKISNRENKGWLDLESLESFPERDLCTIDHLWLKYSNGRFGFGVKKKIWLEVEENAVVFGHRLGWCINNNWLSRYSDYTFSLNAPIGHLPSLKWCYGWRLKEDVYEQEYGSPGRFVKPILSLGDSFMNLFSNEVEWEGLSKEDCRAESLAVLFSKLFERTF